jgi:hypothetical protein
MWLPRALTALGGAALLGSLWLTWFRYEEETLVPVDGASIDVFVGADSANAWELLSAPENVALAAIGLVAMAALVRPVAALAVRVLGAVAVALVVFRVVSPPEAGFGASTGAFVALAGALVALAGAWLVRRDVA